MDERTITNMKRMLMKIMQGREDMHPSRAIRKVGTPLPEYQSGSYFANER